MRKKLEPGIFIEKHIKTTQEMAASRFHKNSPQVLSSPSLITFMQTSCADLLAPFLEEGEMSVSIRIDMSHLSSTPIGMDINIRAEVTSIMGHTVYFKVEAFDEVERIAKALNEMFIIDKERFTRGIKRKTGEDKK
jgi:fluoroacetyl-CoA thioesterase